MPIAAVQAIDTQVCPNSSITYSDSADTSCTGAARFEVVPLDVTCDFIASDEPSLNLAIQCANDEPGGHAIEIIADILLTDSTLPIDNPGSTITLIGGGHTVDAQGMGRVFTIAANTTVQINTLTITGGTYTQGAGIHNAGVLTLLSSTVDNNTSVHNVNPAACTSDTNGDGGGIYNSGTLNVIESTVSHNTTAQGTSCNNGVTLVNTRGGHGGGIYSTGTLNITNSTISGNTTGNNGGGATSAGSGAGIYSSGQLALSNTTITANTVGTGGSRRGGGLYATGGMRTMRNTLIAENTAAFGPDIYGSITSFGNNLVGSSSGATISGITGSNILGEDPMLAPLDDNGGPSFTHALQPDSPAINTGSNSLATGVNFLPLTTDQRGTGFPRILNDVVDIGAFETPCNTWPYFVGTETELSEAITCYNTITTPGTYTITLTADLMLTGPLPGISNASPDVVLQIIGSDSVSTRDLSTRCTCDTYTIDGQDTYPLLDIGPETTVELQSLTLANGHSVDGGGLYNQGDLTINASVLTHNVADHYGGGLYNAGGTVLFTDSEISYNIAQAGGAYFNDGGTVTLQNTVLIGNIDLNMGQIEVEKVVDWGEHTPDTAITFEICIAGPTHPGGTCQTVDYDGGIVTFYNLDAGSYSVYENNPGEDWTVTGWGTTPAEVSSGVVAQLGITNTYEPPDNGGGDNGGGDMGGGDNGGGDNGGGDNGGGDNGGGDNGGGDPTCTDPDPARDLKHESSFINEPPYNTGVIVNLSDACSYDVGMASYKMVDNTIDNQILFDNTTTTIGPGQTLNLSISLPGCGAQVDLFFGPLLNDLNGQRYGNRLIDGALVEWGNWCVVDGD